MDLSCMIKFLAVSIIISSGLITGCIQKENIQKEKGILEGHVSIGPLCPVEPCNITSENLRKVYEATKIFIYSEDRKSLIKEISLNSTGNYKVELDPGMYVLDTEHIGIGGSKDLPKNIRIETGKTTILDIDIDTGIR